MASNYLQKGKRKKPWQHGKGCLARKGREWKIPVGAPEAEKRTGKGRTEMNIHEIDNEPCVKCKMNPRKMLCGRPIYSLKRESIQLSIFY